MKQIFCTVLKGQEKPVNFCYTPRTKLLFFSVRDSGTETDKIIYSRSETVRISVLSECNECQKVNDMNHAIIRSESSRLLTKVQTY